MDAKKGSVRIVRRLGVVAGLVLLGYVIELGGCSRCAGKSDRHGERQHSELVLVTASGTGARLPRGGWERTWAKQSA